LCIAPNSVVAHLLLENDERKFETSEEPCEIINMLILSFAMAENNPAAVPTAPCIPLPTTLIIFTPLM